MFSTMCVKHSGNQADASQSNQRATAARSAALVGLLPARSAQYTIVLQSVTCQVSPLSRGIWHAHLQRIAFDSVSRRSPSTAAGMVANGFTFLTKSGSF